MKGLVASRQSQPEDFAWKYLPFVPLISIARLIETWKQQIVDMRRRPSIIGTEKYNRVTVKHDDKEFSIYCTKYSLDKRRDEVIMWADNLARKLGWLDYQMEISLVSKENAEERSDALFESRFPKYL